MVNEQVILLREKYIKTWFNTNKEFKSLGNKISLKSKLAKELQMNRFISHLFKHLKSCPKAIENQALWREELWNIIIKFGKKSGFTEDEINSEFRKELPAVTNKFISSFKEFSSGANLDKVVQALRNVWIMNILQDLFDIKVEHTDSVFAYSMLYPYTDNYLDSNKISIEDKKIINSRFKERLEGKTIEPLNEYEKDLFKLVSLIEKQYNRTQYKEVYESLLSIHEAQCASLTQQMGKLSPYEKDILGISIQKGGISVLADAYLVKPRLRNEEIDFVFAYGAVLQFCDDLQDAKEDLKNDHMTIFSQTAHNWPLDKLTNSLFDFANKIVENDEGFISEKAIKIKEFLRKNVTFLLFEAVSQNRNLYTRKYIREIEQFYPFRMCYTRRLYKKIEKRYSKFKSINGISMDDVILIATDTID